MEPSNSQDLARGSHDSSTSLTTVPEITISPVGRDLHHSLPLTKSFVDDENPASLQDIDGDDHGSPTLASIKQGSLPPTKFLIGDEVTYDKEDVEWYTEKEAEDSIAICVAAEANSIRAELKKQAVHQMLVLLHLFTNHYGDRCSGLYVIQDWMLSMLDDNLRRAYDDALAHIRNEREPDPNNQHGAFLNLWIRRTIERHMQNAVNESLVGVIEDETRKGCTIDLESYERLLSKCGIQNDYCQRLAPLM